jgi:tetratricopeptide (TPR) repeat protein
MSNVHRNSINSFTILITALALQFALLTVWSGPTTGVAFAQEEKKEPVNKKRPLKGKRVQALSGPVNKLITKANELYDAKDVAGASREVNKAKALKDLRPYDIAQINYFSGVLNSEAEKYRAALADFNTVIKQPDLPEGLKQQTYGALAQISFLLEDYDAAIRYANEYITNVGPIAQMYIVIGQAYYQKGQYKNMIAPIETAIKMTEDAGGKTNETWWQLLRVAYWEQKNYRKVKDIMEVLVSNWPKKSYWLQLSAVYSELDDEDRQLAAYEAAYDQGMLESSSELVTMGQLFMQGGAPYKGAKVMQEGLNSGAIERNVRNLRALAQAYQMAQEDRKALDPLNQAAKLSDDGELYVRLARSYLNLSEYKLCIDASSKALNKGGLKGKGDTHVVMGKCQFENKQYSRAKTAFQNAVKFERTKKTARAWLGYVSNEQARLKQLEDSLKLVRRGNKSPDVDTVETEAPAAEEAIETT